MQKIPWITLFTRIEYCSPACHAHEQAFCYFHVFNKNCNIFLSSDFIFGLKTNVFDMIENPNVLKNSSTALNKLTETKRVENNELKTFLWSVGREAYLITRFVSIFATRKIA